MVAGERRHIGWDSEDVIAAGSMGGGIRALTGPRRVRPARKDERDREPAPTRCLALQHFALAVFVQCSHHRAVFVRCAERSWRDGCGLRHLIKALHDPAPGPLHSRLRAARAGHGRRGGAARVSWHTASRLAPSTEGPLQTSASSAQGRPCRAISSAERASRRRPGAACTSATEP